LQNRVAFVTGGGSGICFEVTRHLLRHGCMGATICGRRETVLQNAARALSRDTGRIVHYVVCDVRDAEKCRDAIQYSLEMFHGQLDILVNGAAGNFLADAGYNLKPKGFKTVVDIDALGTYNMSFWAHPALKRSKFGGCIINISATLHYGATWWQTHASAAKAAVDSITRSLALEWGEFNIRVNGIAPGPIANTPGTTKLAPSMNSLERSEDTETNRLGIPLGRLGSTSDIAEAAVFLASEGARFITGHTLVVDGGHNMFKSPLIRREMVSPFSSSVEFKSRIQQPDLLSRL
jgi:peroxisomal 2,4-dienoyl-CoA reductase